MVLCFSCLRRFLLSARLTGGGAPIAVRAMALTALVARNGLGFFFFGTGTDLTTKDTMHHKGFQKSYAGLGLKKRTLCSFVPFVVMM